MLPKNPKVKERKMKLLSQVKVIKRTYVFELDKVKYEVHTINGVHYDGEVIIKVKKETDVPVCHFKTLGISEIPKPVIDFFSHKTQK